MSLAEVELSTISIYKIYRARVGVKVIELKDSSLDEVFLKKAVNERRVYLNCEIDRTTVTKTKFMIDKILLIDRMAGKSPRECEPITLVINSYGGEVHATLDMISYIRRLQRQNFVINTECESIAMSGGFFIFITGNHRSCQEFAEFMCHDQRMVVYDLVTMGSLRDMFAEWSKQWKVLKDIIIEYTDITDEEIEKYVSRKEDWYITAKEAKSLKIVDQIL